MASTKPFLEAVQSRRTFYSLKNESPISDEKIEEIVSFAVKHCPSAFNVQSARAVILLREKHERLWDMADAMLKRTVPEQVYGTLGPKVKGYRAGYGTVLWFEDEGDLLILQQKNAMIANLVPEWSMHSNGMHQYVAWTALEAEGFGCNLQHYNFSPELCREIADEWKLPANWKLYSQLVFGTPVSGPMDKSFKPVEDRVKLFA